MDDLLNYGVEKLEIMLMSNPTTREAFQTIADVFEEISTVIEEENRGIIAGLIREYYILYTLYSA